MKIKIKKNKLQGMSLWRWICTRLLSLAIGSFITIISVVWLRYYLPAMWISDTIPDNEKAELSVLLENPYANINRYHELIDKWYGIELSDPTFGASDWGLFILLILVAVVVMIFLTLRTVRPISLHITYLAQVARSVSKGDFGKKVENHVPVPSELNGLTEDINLMSTQLARFDRDLKVSHIALAHELRSPLTAAIGRLQGMIDGIFPASADQHALVMRQLQHLNRLVDDLHLLSLAHANQLHLNIQELAIDDVIKEKVAWIKPKLMQTGISVTVESENQLLCKADHFRIGQVVLILLDNALRYASEGKKIEIHCYSTSEAVCFEVKDYGNGVPDEYLKEIFGQFSRADASRSRNRGGSGLGLSIAEAICQAHQGSITVARNVPRGLKFKVSLPKING
ncbi:HAMP domain-containing histidine kinase [Cronobacter muytjensii]|nr:HAMP domain-containing histidine kinase [Cronobacter muytjensii]